MADEPVARKRPVSAKRPIATKRAPAAPRSRRPARPILEDEAPSTNYALRLTDAIVDDEELPSSTVRRGLGAPAAAADDSFALRLSEALNAISAAQAESPLPLGEVARSAGEGRAIGDDAAPHPLDKASPRGRGSLNGWLAALDKLPPIRLPIGPAIPWRIGLPLLAALVIVMGVMSRSASQSDQPGVQLPAQQTYPVQTEAPLFAKPQAPDTNTTTTTTEPTPAPASAPIGVQDPTPGFDVMDIGIKLIAVLALAYASLMLLRKAGLGGAGGAGRSGGLGNGVRVVSSLALAPNRSVHVIRVPGGRTLLVGATPNAVNLIADLGELAEDEMPEAASFIDVLKGKIGQ